MPLIPSTRLGPYEILAPLGAGAMGEVYRARDPKLGRELALKVLRIESVGDDGARARMLREAQLAASLNHPNICTIHEVGEASGHIYLAMELIDGRPLSEKVTEWGTGLPIESVMRYGAQIAAALAHAHERHVIHRDLKCSNVMILPDGGVKVVDLGVARRAREPVDETARTLQMTLTETGAIVGTPHYVAPEVLHGGKADERSDLWALGVVLYEMASGSLPFKGTTSFELASAILHDVPAALPDRVPAGLKGVIEKCLAKEPGERYARASEARAALEALGSGQRISILPAAAPTTTADVVSVRRWPSIGVGRWAILGAVVASITATIMLWTKGPWLNPEMRTRIVDVPMSGIDYPGLSQDGRWIALPVRDERGIWGLYFMNSRGGDVRPIAVDTAFQVDQADISPDGSQVAYSGSVLAGNNAMTAEVRVVPALGGPVRTVARAGLYPVWSPDGRRIGYRARGNKNRLEFWTVRPDGSGRRLEFSDSLTPFGIRTSAAWSPDGRQIAWLRGFQNPVHNEIVIRDLHTGRERQLTHDRKTIDEIAWTRQNEIVFSSNRGGATNLWIMRASGGRPVQLTRGPGPDLALRVSSDGRTLLYLNQQQLARASWWNVETGERGMVTRDDQPMVATKPSPDGRLILVIASDPDVLTPTVSLVVMNRDGSGRRVVVPAADDPRDGTWSPDGRRLAWATVSRSNADSALIHIVDLRGGETSATMGAATHGPMTYLRWSKGDTLQLGDQDGSFWYSISGRRAFGRSPDSTGVILASTRGWTVFSDWRANQIRIYVRPNDGGTPRFVYRPKPSEWCGVPDRAFLYCWPDSLGFCRLHLPSGRLERVKNLPSDIRSDMIFWSTRDGRMTVWLEPRVTSKLVLIENLHR